MKFFLLIALFITGIVPTNLKAQVHIIPNTAPVDDYVYSANQPLFGDIGDNVVYNSNLYVKYQPVLSDLQLAGSGPIQLAKYDGVNALTLITNPDAGKGFVFGNKFIIYNNNLYSGYTNTAGVVQLAQYDGTSVTLIPNPDASSSGFAGAPIVFNSKLYIAYRENSGVIQLAQFDGTSLTLVPNPDASIYGYQGNPILFNNKLCIKYANITTGAWQLAQYDGTNWTLFSNPDASPYGYQGNPIVYNGKLYMQYYTTASQYQLMVFDGTNAPTLITNPDTDTNNGGYAGFPIIYNGNLYINYYNASGVYQLAKYDGTSITLIPNPDVTSYGYWNTPIIYNNKLCIFYRGLTGVHELAQYDGTSFTLVPNPDASPNGYWDQPIVYGSNLYFEYNNTSGVLQLGYYDGTSMKLIANPAGTYSGYPVIFNNLLFMQFTSPQYNNFGNLAYFDALTLPITLLSFTAQAQGSDALLQWQTATEINNKYFEVEHSSDGVTFTPLGTVQGHGTTSLEQQYSFKDNNPLKGINYYRLKQIDYDGNFSYSNIARVDFEGSTSAFSVYPNPASGIIQVSLPSNTSASVLRMYDMNGKKVMEKQFNANTTSQQLDISNFAAGIYHLDLVQGTKTQGLQLIKK